MQVWEGGLTPSSRSVTLHSAAPNVPGAVTRRSVPLGESVVSSEMRSVPEGRHERRKVSDCRVSGPTGAPVCAG